MANSRKKQKKKRSTQKAKNDLVPFGLRDFKIIPVRRPKYRDDIIEDLNYATQLAKISPSQKAEELLKDIIARKRSTKEAYANLGLLYTERHDYEAAIAILQQAIKRFPHFVMPYLNLADTYLLVGISKEPEKSCKAWKR